MYIFVIFELILKTNGKKTVSVDSVASSLRRLDIQRPNIKASIFWLSILKGESFVLKYKISFAHDLINKHFGFETCTIISTNFIVKSL